MTRQAVVATTAAVPATEQPKRTSKGKTTGRIAGVITGEQVWKTELKQIPTTHGPMDIRLWREVK